MGLNIVANIIKSQLPGIIEELKKEAPNLIRTYLPKLIEEHKDKVPLYLENLKAFALAELRKFDFNMNGIPDIDEYQGDFDEVVGHLSAVFNVGLRVKERIDATKAKVAPEKKEVTDAKAPE